MNIINHANAGSYAFELPPLDFDLLVLYYSQKTADAEYARLESSEAQKLLADISADFDGDKMRLFRQAMIETARFMGWNGGAA